MKVCSPDSLCVEIDSSATGKRYNFRKGIADVPDRDAKTILREGGFLPSLSGTAHSAGGFACKCGFRPFFRTCSRCGGNAERMI